MHLLASSAEPTIYVELEVTGLMIPVLAVPCRTNLKTPISALLSVPIPVSILMLSPSDASMADWQFRHRVVLPMTAFTPMTAPGSSRIATALGKNPKSLFSPFNELFDSSIFSCSVCFAFYHYPIISSGL